MVKSRERRLPPAAWFDVDFWRFDAVCQRAVTAADDAARTTALHEALAPYRGLLLAGRDDLWVLTPPGRPLSGMRSTPLYAGVEFELARSGN